MRDDECGTDLTGKVLDLVNDVGWNTAVYRSDSDDSCHIVAWREGSNETWSIVADTASAAACELAQQVGVELADG